MTKTDQIDRTTSIFAPKTLFGKTKEVGTIVIYQERYTIRNFLIWGFHSVYIIGRGSKQRFFRRVYSKFVIVVPKNYGTDFAYITVRGVPVYIPWLSTVWIPAINVAVNVLLTMNARSSAEPSLVTSDTIS